MLEEYVNRHIIIFDIMDILQKYRKFVIKNNYV